MLTTFLEQHRTGLLKMYSKVKIRHPVSAKPQRKHLCLKKAEFDEMTEDSIVNDLFLYKYCVDRM